MSSQSEPDISYLDPGDGRRVAIKYRAPGSPELPTIVFLPGYASDMDGQKALAVDLFCAARGLGCLRMDYSGTGSSAGDFAEGTLARWLDEVLAAVDLGAPEGKLILVGSSMGGWLALHAALVRKDRVAAILGIAAAPDFTDWGYTAEEREIILRDGKVERANPYGPEPSVIHRGFFESGLAMRLLWLPIDVTVPIRLVCGEKDEDVPIGVSLKLVEQLRSSDVQMKLIKNGGHRLSEPHEIHAILVELQGLVELAK